MRLLAFALLGGLFMSPAWGQTLAPPTSVAASPIAPDDISLSWADTNAVEDGYAVERARESASFYQHGVTSANGVAYTDTNAVVGITYRYRVRAFSGSGTARRYSVYSTIVSAVAGSAPPPPPNNPPSAVDDANAGEVGQAIVGNVLTNDSDPDGDPLAVAQPAGPIAADGSYSITPTAAGTFSYPYTANDGRGGTDIANLVVTVTEPPPPAELLAFPGAVGYGRNVVGGRGGTVYVVDSLADAGPGTLRECVEATEPRTCVFSTSGTIELMSSLKLRRGYITIAGQTAPGQGIQVKYHPSPTLGTHAIYIGDSSATTPEQDRAHDIIIRHVKFRPGFDNTNTTIWRRGSSDAIGMERAWNVILDHVDSMWAGDENLNLHQVPGHHITISNSIIAEGLRDHSKGGLTCSDGVSEGCHSITWVGNLFHSNDNRNPSLPASGCIDFVNNVISNQGVRGTEIWDNYGNVRVNVIGNTYRRGPSSNSNGYTSAGIFISDANSPDFSPTVYSSDNLAIGLPLVDSTGIQPNAASPVCPLSVTPVLRDTAETNVYTLAGAWPRDDASQRIITESGSGLGAVPYSSARRPGLSGVWPVYSVVAGPADADRDGMSDEYENANGLDPSNPDDRNGTDAAGYTRLEIYLDYMHREVSPQPTS
jgi:pectate lyase